MKQSKEMDQLKKVQLEHLEFLEKQNEQVFHLKGIKRYKFSQKSVCICVCEGERKKEREGEGEVKRE